MLTCRIFASANPTTQDLNAKPSPKVVVIGGGVGGLASAGRLARAGCSVTLLEKNENIGGRVQSQHVNEWRFDTGPSLLLFPQKYEEAFEALGTPLASVLTLQRIDPAAYRVFFPASPSFRIDLLNDETAMAAQLESLETGAGSAYFKFLQMARSHLEMGLPYFIDRDFTELKDAKGLMDLLPKLSSINPWRLLGPHDYVMSGFFKDPRIRAAFTFQDLYVGLSPRYAPAVFSLLAGTELTDGVWYPIGGFGAVRDALAEAVIKCGVDICTNSEVQGIEVGSTGAVQGVILRNGDFVPADVVVCNRDLPAAYALLLGGTAPSAPIIDHATKKERQLGKLNYSAGIIEFNWCIRGKLPELTHHNIFLSEEYNRAWKLPSSSNEFVKHPNFYVHVPSKTDPTAAPEGCESMMVLLPVSSMAGPDHKGAQEYSKLIDEGRQRVLQAFKDAGVGELDGMIEHEVIISPPEWEEKYGLRYGAAFGLSHGLDQLSLFRPGNKDDVIQGLYFVGASTRPGNGVPLCFIGAKLTAERVLKDLKLG